MDALGHLVVGVLGVDVVFDAVEGCEDGAGVVTGADSAGWWGGGAAAFCACSGEAEALTAMARRAAEVVGGCGAGGEVGEGVEDGEEGEGGGEAPHICGEGEDVRNGPRRSQIVSDALTNVLC